MRVILLLSFTLCYTQVALEIQNVDTDTGILDIYMINSEPVKGFQFELFGMTLTGISGGLAYESLDFVEYNAATSVILGVSFATSIIPVGEDVLTQVSFSDYEGYICFGTDPDNNVVSDCGSGEGAGVDGCGGVGVALYTDWGDCYGNYTLGCTELSACNYNPDATVDDGSCSYSEENYDCDGNCAVEIDCAGECGGDAVLSGCDDACNSTAVEDCAGICFGNAVIDCLGNCGGSAVIDECGVCEGDGVWQVCGCGSPDEFGIPDGDCDCDGNVVDCAGLCGKNSVCLSIENVNIVSNILNVTMINNQSVGGFQFTLDGIDIESVSGGSSAENGFSIATNPQMILGVSESANAIPAGNGVLTSIYFSNYAGGDICFGSEPEKNIISDEFGYELYSIWGDCYISTEDCDTTYDCAGVCGGDAVEDECGICGGDITDVAECGADCNATTGEHLNQYGLDCTGVCGGSSVEDECGVCNGDGPAENYDCSGDCISVIDCTGVCGGNSVEDECGVCNGDGAGENYDCSGNCISVIDCTGVCGGSSVEDECGVCNGDGAEENYNCEGNCLESVDTDCFGVCGGISQIDVCGNCDGGIVTSSDCDDSGCMDSSACNFNNLAITDNGSCVIPPENYNCEGECISLLDCHGVCGGSLLGTGADDLGNDECGICTGTGPPEHYNCLGNCIANVDCNGLCGGSAIEDACGVCDGSGPPLNYNCLGECIASVDCNGLCGGSSVEDECGVCNGDGIDEGECDCDGNVQDCTGVCGGDATAEDCDACTSGVFDCIGVCDGSAELDECGECGGDGIDEGECDCDGNVQDCTGVCGGDATAEDCDACTSGVFDCIGVCDGSAVEDECGVCGGDGLADGFECDGVSLSLFNGLIPEDFSISNIYPNPFNPTTNIIYELPENNTVKIAVYDLNGHIIRHLVNEFQIAGIYTVTWKATDYPSGLYFIHLQSGSLYHTRKVVLLK